MLVTTTADRSCSRHVSTASGGLPLVSSDADTGRSHHAADGDVWDLFRRCKHRRPIRKREEFGPTRYIKFFPQRDARPPAFAIASNALINFARPQAADDITLVICKRQDRQRALISSTHCKDRRRPTTEDGHLCVDVPGIHDFARSAGRSGLGDQLITGVGRSARLVHPPIATKGVSRSVSLGYRKRRDKRLVATTIN